MLYNLGALDNARYFEFAFETLYKIFNEGTPDDKEVSKLGVPVIVNCAFTCELYMKAMIPREELKKLKMPERHMLNMLFDKMDSHIKDGIRDNMIQLMKEHDAEYDIVKFEKDLSENGNAFKDWRYFYEGKSLHCDLTFLIFLLKCLRAFSMFEVPTEF